MSRTRTVHRHERRWDAEDTPGWRQCRRCDKVAYPTRALARAARKRLLGMGARRRGLHVYRCPRAPLWWHVGHRPESHPAYAP